MNINRQKLPRNSAPSRRIGAVMVHDAMFWIMVFSWLNVQWSWVLLVSTV